jgi:hypothetical protein
MTDDDILDERFRVLYRAEYSSRYHRRRAAFLGNLDTLLNLVTVAAGASAFGDLIGGSPGWLAKIGAALVTLISLSQVILRLGNHAASHTQWLKRWTSLLCEIKATLHPTEQQIANWLQDMGSLETDCVGELRALCYDCENAAARFMGLSNRQVAIKSWQRLIIHFGTFQQTFPLISDSTSPMNARTEAAK